MTRIYEVQNTIDNYRFNKIVAHNIEDALQYVNTFISENNILCSDPIELMDVTEYYLNGKYRKITEKLLSSSEVGFAVLLIGCMDMRDVLLKEVNKDDVVYWSINNIKYRNL